MLRTLLFYLRFIPASIVYSAATVLMQGGARPKWGERRWGASAVKAAGIRLEADLSAMDHGPCVIMANHQSNLDIPVLVHCFPQRRIGFVAKQSLFEIPLFGKAMLASGHVPIDRSNRRRAMKSMDNAAQAASRGVTVVIFPEGTRNPDPSAGLQEFKIGGMIMALKCGLPVVPVVIHGTGDVVRKGSGRIRPGVVRVRALPALSPSDYTLKDRERFRDDLYAVMSRAHTELSRG